MYLSFYGLKEKPFNTTPDRKCLCRTPGRREALAQLVYSVQEKRGFLVLTGEVGTGKTTLLQAFLQRLNGKAVVAYVLDSTLPFEGLLEYMLEELGVPTPASSPAQRLLALRRFMLDRRRAGQTTVLVVDEAQNLDTAALEKIRMLSNFETPTEKLLQILLVGQPELRAKLNRPELRQLQQRIELRCDLPPLSHGQIRDYIQTRLRVAGASDPELFSDRAQSRIAAYSRGIPRRVNILCDHCPVIGYADQRQQTAAAGAGRRGGGGAAAAPRGAGRLGASGRGRGGPRFSRPGAPCQPVRFHVVRGRAVPRAPTGRGDAAERRQPSGGGCHQPGGRRRQDDDRHQPRRGACAIHGRPRPGRGHRPSPAVAGARVGARR